MADTLTNPNGSILNFFCEMPHHLSNTEIDDAFGALNTELVAMREPPVASLSESSFDLGSIEDYRLFYVQFEADATTKDIHDAVDIVMAALARLSAHG